MTLCVTKVLSVKGNSARLACVKHAASVRPEPGSNSLIKIVLESLLALNYLLWLVVFLQVTH